ncbi:MAG: hypothetical protein IJ997_01025 [Mycoplasmataceae bacterium]|nr:hypothetical protein [Mycoplasmataceae bacterium]
MADIDKNYSGCTLVLYFMVHDSTYMMVHTWWYYSTIHCGTLVIIVVEYNCKDENNYGDIRNF